MNGPFRYARRVQFAETDLAGIVHFSWMFRYMEEAEHAAWRAAGLSIAARSGDLGWPRVAASFDFRSPLRFEDEFEVIVRLAEVGTRSLQYEHTISKGDVLIGTGRIKTVCTRTNADGSLRATEIPADIIGQLRCVLDGDPAVSSPAPDVPV
jgi:acyl-CoA thioester hydrolase